MENAKAIDTFLASDNAQDELADPDALHCDYCDVVENAGDLTYDWNGETGNHLSCEDQSEEAQCLDCDTIFVRHTNAHGDQCPVCGQRQVRAYAGEVRECEVVVDAVSWPSVADDKWRVWCHRHGLLGYTGETHATARTWADDHKWDMDPDTAMLVRTLE